MSPSYLLSDEEWFAMGLDEENDPPNYYDDGGEPDPEDFDEHPSLTAEQRNPSMRNERLY